MIIEGDSIAECWLKILSEICNGVGKEISPLVVSINATKGKSALQNELENDINNYLGTLGAPCIETTAGTIFPDSLSRGSKSIYDRYEKTWKYIKKDRLNSRGTYFRRLTAYGEKYGEGKNQLQHIVNTYIGANGKTPIHRKSALIATTFDPLLDHIPAPMLGFPCLQQVCFIPSGTKLTMNAVYAKQYLSTRAYGNYLGLMRLGEFMANKMGLEFSQLNCMVSVLDLGDKMTKGEAKKLLSKYVKK